MKRNLNSQDSVDEPIAMLTLVSGPDPKDVVCLPEKILIFKKTAIVGRSKKQADIVIDLTPVDDKKAEGSKPTISRTHAEINPSRGKLFVRDLNSTNGIFRNNIKVSHALLEFGDILQLGGAAGVPEGTKFMGNAVAACYKFEQANRHTKRKKESPQQTNNIYDNLSSELEACKNELFELKSKYAAIETLKISFEEELSMWKTERRKLETKQKDEIGEILSTTWNSIKKELICPVCKDVLLDAVVLPCSHAFCFLCWYIVDSKLRSPEALRCPICTRKYDSAMHPYRSMHLDNTISLIFKNTVQEETSKWEKRVEESTRSIDKLGLRQVYFGQDAETDSMIQSQFCAEESQMSVDQQSCGVFCEGCNEHGHNFDDCPHRSESALEDSDSSDSESDG